MVGDTAQPAGDGKQSPATLHGMLIDRRLIGELAFRQRQPAFGDPTQ